MLILSLDSCFPLWKASNMWFSWESMKDLMSFDFEGSGLACSILEWKSSCMWCLMIDLCLKGVLINCFQVSWSSELVWVISGTKAHFLKVWRRTLFSDFWAAHRRSRRRWGYRQGLTASWRQGTKKIVFCTVVDGPYYRVNVWMYDELIR